MAANEAKECDEFITWEVKDFHLLCSKNSGFVDFSPSFYMPYTGECEWQLEIVCGDDQVRPRASYAQVPSKASYARRYIELKLRLIQAEVTREVFRKPFSIVILCSLQNSNGEYYSTFYNRETFCYATNKTSWCSQKIECQSLVTKLNGGLLKIRLKLELIVYPTCDVPAHKVPLEIHDYLKKMLKGGLFTDMAIVDAEGHETHVHKCVMASRCPVVNDILQSPVVSNTDTPKIYTMLCKEALSEFIEFSYTGALSSAVHVSIALQLIQAAVNYGMPDLRKACEDILVVKLDVSNCLNVLIFADDHEELGLRRRALEFISANREHFLEEDSFNSVQNLKLLKDLIEYTAGPYISKLCIS